MIINTDINVIVVLHCGIFLGKLMRFCTKMFGLLPINYN